MAEPVPVNPPAPVALPVFVPNHVGVFPIAANGHPAVLLQFSAPPEEEGGQPKVVRVLVPVTSPEVIELFEQHLGTCARQAVAFTGAQNS